MLGEAGAKKARKEMRARGYAEDVIDSEIVADSLFDVLSEKGIIKEMSKETRVSVADMLRHLSDSIREMLSRLTGTETWRIELRDKATNYRHLSNMFMNAMDTAADDVQRAELVEDIRGEVRYSIKYTTDNKPVVVVEENILDGVPKSEWIKTVKEVIKDKFSDGVPVSGRLIKVNRITRNEYVGSAYSKNIRRFDSGVYRDKFKAANNLGEIVLSGTNYINEDLKHARKDSFKEFARGDILLRIGQNDYSANIIVGFTASGEMVLYDLVDFQKTSFAMKKRIPNTGPQEANSDRSGVSSDNTISQNKGIVNTIISENSENDSTKRQSKKKEAEIKQNVTFRIAENESTSVKFEETSSYPYDMRTVIDGYIKGIDPVFLSFVEEAKKETNKKRLAWMHHTFENNFSEQIKEKISDLLGFDVSDYKVQISGEGIKHIEKRHGKNGQNDSSMRDNNDVARMPFIIENADNAQYTLNRSGERVYDSQYRDKYNNPSPVISIIKRIDGTYYCALACPDSKNKTLHIKSAFIKKKTIKSSMPLSPELTSETNLDKSSERIISQNEKKVNEFEKKTFDKKQSKKKEPVKALKAEDVFGKDYKAEYAALKEETENIRKEIAALTAQEHIESGYRQKQTERLTQILKNKEALLKRMDSLRTILAQLQAKNANVSRYAKLFLDNFQAVKKTGSYRATGENWEIMKAVSEITDTYEPTVSDFATKAGLAKLQKEHKQIYDAFMAYARDKAYIRPFNLSECKSVLEKLAKEYKAEGADISGLAAELKNAVEIYLNKAADKQPSYEALVREFDVILSDITEKSEKLADKSEWAQKIKGQTVKLVGDQYRNVIDTFGSLAEANRYMNGAVKFSLMLVFCTNTGVYRISRGL